MTRPTAITADTSHKEHVPRRSGMEAARRSATIGAQSSLVLKAVITGAESGATIGGGAGKFVNEPSTQGSRANGHFPRSRSRPISPALGNRTPPLTDSSPNTGIEAAYLANRQRLLRFLVARGAGNAAEELLQEIWLRIAARNSGPVASPLPYLFRVADSLVIDRFRSVRQAVRRDRDWSEANDGTVPGVSDAPSAERQLVAREHARLAMTTLEGLGERPAALFRRHRVDGVAQRQLAEEFQVSLSTVESDLRRAYAALAALKERIDEV